MNSITRETIEHAIKSEQNRLSNLERERDEIVDRIGALKEDLASEAVHTNYKWYTDAPHRASA